MLFYKIRHKPSGLYYRPVHGMRKSNLSKTGKVYQKRPTLKNLGCSVYWALGKDAPWPPYELRRVVLDEWEIVEFKAGE